MSAAFCYLALACACSVGLAATGEMKPPAGRPIVGANRWDGCWQGSPFVKAVSTPEWRHVLPFYAKVTPDGAVEVRGDVQSVMDAEIAYAKRAGLDFWAFDYYHPRSGAAQYDYGLNLYLASAHRRDINFCLLIFPGPMLGPVEEWRKTVDSVLLRYMKEPTYQKVLGNRPLLFIYMVGETERYFGSPEKAREGWTYLRRRAREAGLGAPYIVAQVWSAQSGVEAIEKYGYDAMSAYAWVDVTLEAKEYAYEALARANREYWEACKATGKPMIPIVSTGWDNRPLRGEDKKDLYPQGAPGPWYAEPTPEELAAHLRAAIKWTEQNTRSAEIRVVYIYAWNETGEGGRLVPTLREGSARLDGSSGVLRKPAPSPSALKSEGDAGGAGAPGT